jgi:hypothetical protein
MFTTDLKPCFAKTLTLLFRRLSADRNLVIDLRGFLHLVVSMNWDPVDDLSLGGREIGL